VNEEKLHHQANEGAKADALLAELRPYLDALHVEVFRKFRASTDPDNAWEVRCQAWAVEQIEQKLKAAIQNGVVAKAYLNEGGQ
jgi:hypothetical protein